jgi:hypothetical protein
VVNDSVNSSLRAGTSNNLEKCGLGAPEIGGDGKDSWERSSMETTIRRVDLGITIKWECHCIQLFEWRATES